MHTMKYATFNIKLANRNHPLVELLFHKPPATETSKIYWTKIN